MHADFSRRKNWLMPPHPGPELARVLIRRTLFSTLAILLLFNLRPVRSTTLKVGALVARNYAGTGPWPPYHEEILNAAEKFISDQEIVKGHTIEVVLLDDGCIPKDGIITVVQALNSSNSDKVKGFIGPGCSEVCKNTAYIASKEGFDVPMISYACTLDNLSKKEIYSTFARTVSNVASNAQPVIRIIEAMKWERIGIIYRNLMVYEEAATELKTIIEEKVPKLPHYDRDFPNGFKVVCFKVWYYTVSNTATKLPKAKGAQDIRDECKDEVRVFMILAYDSDVIEFLKFAYEDSTFPFKESAFISLEVTVSQVTDENKDYTRGLLSLVPKSPNNKIFDNLTRTVRNDKNDDTIKLDIYSATLYDSLLTYAYAAQKILSMYPGDISKVYDGTLMTQVIGNQSDKLTFVGASGNVTFNENADRESNTDIFQAQERDGSMVMIPIFETSKGGSLNRTDADLQWNDGTSDIPLACGEDRELCTEPNIQKTIMMVVLPIGVLLLVIAAIILIFLMWRNKVQRLQDRCLWKIRSIDVEFKDAAAQSGRFSRSVDRSMSRMSNLSDTSLNHGIVAYYKNEPVYLKYLNTEIKQFTVTDLIIQEFKQVRELTHQNLNPYIGACVEVPDNFFLASKYCRKGSLLDVLSDSNFKLDEMFKMSFIFDICKGMVAIHNSPIKFHGRLKSCNCVIDSHWVLKITDYGLRGFLSDYSVIDPLKSEDGKYFDMYWTAPELLKEPSLLGSQKGDVYSFAIIITEIMSMNTPYGDVNCSAKEMITKVMSSYQPPFRPDMPVECSAGLADLIRMCWSENPANRPEFTKVLTSLQHIHPQKSRSITDRMIKMMEQYTDNLEELVAERSQQLAIEKEKADNLLCRMLPKPIAEKLKQGEPVAPQAFDEVTIYFSDIVGFTDLSSQSTPFQVVDLLNDLYTLFDGIIELHDVYKVETIGDAYMVVSGLPTRNGNRHVAEIANMSLDLLKSVKKFKIRHKPDKQLLLRIGMHTGSVCAGVVGHKMPRYCLFGDTVNTSSRMESNGEPLKIHLSSDCKAALDAIGGYILECRGEIAIKGKGKMTTWWLKNKEVSLDEPHLVSSLPQLKQKPDTNASNKRVNNNNNNSNQRSSFRSSKNLDNTMPTETVISIDGGVKPNQPTQTPQLRESSVSSNSKVQLNGSLTKVND